VVQYPAPWPTRSSSRGRRRIVNGGHAANAVTLTPALLAALLIVLGFGHPAH
jgi:hypothetical protein